MQPPDSMTMTTKEKGMKEEIRKLGKDGQIKPKVELKKQ